MKIKNKKRVLLYLALAAAVLLASGAVTWYLLFRDPTQHYRPKYEQADRNESAPNEQTIKNKPAGNNPLPETSEEVTVSDAGSLTINDLSQANGFVNVSVTVKDFQVIRCVYTFSSPGARPIVRETKSCDSLSIPEIEFEKIGRYTFTVTAYSNEKKIESIKDIDIR